MSILPRATWADRARSRRLDVNSIEQITIKDGYKAVLTCSKHDNNRHHLADAQGATVLIVVADPDEFTGERAAAPINPDQATLLGDAAMAVHSTDDREMPFH